MAVRFLLAVLILSSVIYFALTYIAVEKIYDEKRLDTIYYITKNEAFGNDNYYNDLSNYQTRIDFARTFACCSVFIGLISLPAIANKIFSGDVGLTPVRRLLLRRLSALFFLAYLCGRLAYTAEEREFDKRAFGYFLNTSAGSSPNSGGHENIHHLSHSQE